MRFGKRSKGGDRTLSASEKSDRREHTGGHSKTRDQGLCPVCPDAIVAGGDSRRNSDPTSTWD